MRQSHSLADKIKGVIYGQVIGDALGLGTELMSKQKIQRHYPFGLSNYEEIVQDDYRSPWRPGDWTDETDQMICTLESLLIQKKVNSYNIATRLYDWAQNNGRGMGLAVARVLQHPAFLSHPSGVARELWQRSKGTSANNESLLPSPLLGIWDFWDKKRVQSNAEKVSKITHYDPRCVGAAAILALTIAHLVESPEGKNPSALIQELSMKADAYDLRLKTCMLANSSSPYFISPSGKLSYYDTYIPQLSQDLGELQLNHPQEPDYILKALGAGFWVLQYSSDFKDGLSSIIHEGGSTGVNASVAGAILGARFGFEAIPKDWVEGLRNHGYLEKKSQNLIHLILQNIPQD